MRHGLRAIAFAERRPPPGEPASWTVSAPSPGACPARLTPNPGTGPASAGTTGLPAPHCQHSLDPTNVPPATMAPEPSFVLGELRMDEWTVYEDQYFVVLAPRLPLNSHADGGHLMLIKKSPVFDRSVHVAGRSDRLHQGVNGRRTRHVRCVEDRTYESMKTSGTGGLTTLTVRRCTCTSSGGRTSSSTRFEANTCSSIPRWHPIYAGHLEPLNASDVAMLRSAD